MILPHLTSKAVRAAWHCAANGSPSFEFPMRQVTAACCRPSEQKNEAHQTQVGAQGALASASMGMPVSLCCISLDGKV